MSNNKTFSQYIREQQLKEDDVVDGKTIDDTIEIFFADLSEDKQKDIMTALLEALNATTDDTFAEKKITEQLASKAIFTVKGNDLKNQLGIKL